MAKRDRLFFLGFDEPAGATTLLELIKESAKQRAHHRCPTGR